MALKLTLPKEDNVLYTEFPEAYWVIEDVAYTVDRVGFALSCYPSREASKKIHEDLPVTSLPIGGAVGGVYYPLLYSWQADFPIIEVFPEGIPLGRDAQLKAIYDWIKVYTSMPFEDVYEQEVENIL